MSRQRDLEVRNLAVTDLVPYARNARTHSKKQIAQIARSIEEFGWVNPIIADDDGRVIAGHGRLEAAKLLGLESVPVIRIRDMSEAQKRAYIIADNRLAELAGWDDNLLAMELADLSLEIDLTLTGFEMGEIDVRIGSLQETGDENDEQDDVVPPVAEGSPVSRPGDLWLLGGHRLLCGDSTLAETYARLMDGEAAQMAFADPPYNVPIQGNVCGLGSVTHAEFAMASGEMSQAQFIAFLKAVMGHMAAASVGGAIHFQCMDWRHIADLLAAGRDVYSELKNICVWSKSNGGMGSLYRSQHEFVAVFKAGSGPHINNVELGRHGRNRTNVWHYAGVNSFGQGRAEALAWHPTVKPVALVEDAILDVSRRGGVVLDPFSGSGTTIIAAERAGRRAFAIEYEPKFVDVALRRWRDMTGEAPVHAETDQAFEWPETVKENDEERDRNHEQ